MNKQKLIKIIVIGNIGVGKTSIINSFCWKQFNKNTQSTLGIDF